MAVCVQDAGTGRYKIILCSWRNYGVHDIWRCIEFSFLAGAVISLAILIFCGNPAERLRYLTSYLEDYLRTGIRKPYYHRGFALENFHFTIPVFMSVMLYAGGIY